MINEINRILGRELITPPESDKENLNKALDNTVKALKEIMLRGIDSAMNKYNS